MVYAKAKEFKSITGEPFGLPGLLHEPITRRMDLRLMTDRPFGPKLMAGNSLKISVWTGIFNNYITINPIPQRINRLPSLPRRGIPTIAVGVNPRSGCEANPRFKNCSNGIFRPEGAGCSFWKPVRDKQCELAPGTKHAPDHQTLVYSKIFVT